MFGLEAIPDIEIKLLAVVMVSAIIGLTINAVTSKVIAYKDRKLDTEASGLAAIQQELVEVKAIVVALSGSDTGKQSDQIERLAEEVRSPELLISRESVQ